jgi:hypothetical protein
MSPHPRRAALFALAIALAGPAAPLPAQFPGLPPQYPGFPPNRPYPPVQPSPPLDTVGPPDGFQTVYRLVDRNSTDHVYTLDLREVTVLTRQGTHQYEGPGFYTLINRTPGSRPLYRFLMPDGNHSLNIQPWAGGNVGARQEGILGYIETAPRPGLRPLNVWYHPARGLYFYTVKGRGELAPATGYQLQGMLGYVAPPQ